MASRSPSLPGRIAKTGEVDEGPEKSHELRKVQHYQTSLSLSPLPSPLSPLPSPLSPLPSLPTLSTLVLILISEVGTAVPLQHLLPTLYSPNIKADAFVEPSEGETYLHACIHPLDWTLFPSMRTEKWSLALLCGRYDFALVSTFFLACFYFLLLTTSIGQILPEVCPSDYPNYCSRRAQLLRHRGLQTKVGR